MKISSIWNCAWIPYLISMAIEFLYHFFIKYKFLLELTRFYPFKLALLVLWLKEKLEIFWFFVILGEPEENVVYKTYAQFLMGIEGGLITQFQPIVKLNSLFACNIACWVSFEPVLDKIFIFSYAWSIGGVLLFRSS